MRKSSQKTDSIFTCVALDVVIFMGWRLALGEEGGEKLVVCQWDWNGSKLRQSTMLVCISPHVIHLAACIALSLVPIMWWLRRKWELKKKIIVNGNIQCERQATSASWNTWKEKVYLQEQHRQSTTTAINFESRQTLPHTTIITEFRWLELENLIL